VLPAGTVTVVLWDAVGSTRALEAAPNPWQGLAALNDVSDEAVGRHDGVRSVKQGEGTALLPPSPAPATPWPVLWPSSGSWQTAN
jgi:hypothetical protein